MFFLLRMAFWLCVVCVLLPSGSKTTSPEAKIDASEAVTLARAAVSDARGFCDRQAEGWETREFCDRPPDACVAGGKVAVAIGHKAEAGARTLYEFVSKLRDKSASGEKAAGRPGSDGTLTPADMAPSWHAPVPLPPRREAREGRPAA